MSQPRTTVRKCTKRPKIHINDDYGDFEQKGEYEYGDLEATSEDTDTSNNNVHQFIAKHETCDPTGSDDSEADAGQNNADEPSPNNFLQKQANRSNEHINEDLEAASDDTNTSVNSIY